MRKQIRAFKAVEKKNLVKSIVTKLKTYASGVIFLIVGARAKRLDDGAIPANYIHLVGGRVRRHRKRKNPGKPWRVKTHRRGWITLPDKTHPGSGRKPFREQAAKNTRKLVAIEFRKRAADLIKKELTKNG